MAISIIIAILVAYRFLFLVSENNGPSQNIAVLPNGTIVQINSINQFVNTNYYVDNSATSATYQDFVFDGYSSLENTTGWALQLAVDKQGVRQARIRVARIDKNATPQPSRQGAGQCWQRGESSFQDCKP
jgi:hypothetical protein